MNYYIDQGNQINEKLNEGTKILEEELRKQIETIKEELRKTNDSTAESHIEKCQNMENKIQEELIVKIDDEIKIVTENAEKWQGWFNSMKNIEGNLGYEGAKAKGFFTKEETVTIEGEKTEAKTSFGKSFVYTDSMALTDALLSLNSKKTKTIYYWTSYTNVEIDGEGHISFFINSYKKEDDVTTNMRTSTATISNDADYDTYYNGRGSIGGAG